MKSLCLFFVNLCAVAYGYAQPLVLRSQSWYKADGPNNSLVIEDSLVHKHHNGRSSTIGVPLLGSYYPSKVYNDDTTIRYDHAGPTGRFSKKFNSKGQVTEFTQEIVGGSFPGITSQTFYTYNLFDLVDTTREIKSNALFNKMETVIYDNGKPKVIDVYRWVPATSSWQLDGRDSFVTIVNGVDSLEVSYMSIQGIFAEMRRHKYTRDVNKVVLSDTFYSTGNLIRATYYLYTPQGKLQTDSATIWDPALLIMKPYTKRSYTYDAQGRMASDSFLVWNYQQSQFVYNNVVNYNYDAQSNVTLIKMTYLVNGVPAFELDSFTYNNHSQVTSAAHYKVSGSTLEVGSRGIGYFYYGFPTSVEKMATTNGLQLFPVPATSYINLNMLFTKPQAFTVRVMDMQGRLIQQWQEPARQTYSKQIPVMMLVPGQYTMHILAADESCSRQFTILR